MKYFKRLEGDNIYLSPVCLDDVERYTKWINDPEICRNIGNNNRVMTLENEKNWLTNIKSFTFAIILRETDTLLGNIEFHSLDQKNRHAKLGIFIGEERERSKGYGTEAMKLLIEYGFQELNLHTILLDVFEFNERAIASYEKLGFEEVGRIKEKYFTEGIYYDEVIMQIMEESWREENE